jgi:DNA modification methylase
MRIILQAELWRLKAQRRKVKQHKTVAVGYNPPRPFYKKQIMQIVVKVDTGYLCNWRDIEPLQPEGFKGQTANEKETLKNSIVKNGFHDAFDVWQHEGRLLSIDGVHRKIALLELAEQGYEIPEQLPCAYVTAANETEAATIILSRNAQHSHILSAAVMTAAFMIPAATIEAVVPQKNLEAWNETEQDNAIQLTAEEDDFEFEEGGIETDIVLGDLFEIGEHRLLCGDSTCSDSVTKLMNGEKADMVFTDPPYGNGTSGKYGRGQLGVRTILNDENFNVVNDFFNLRICDVYVFFLQWRTFKEAIQTLENNNLKLKTIAVWDKKNAGLNGAGGMSEQWEAIIVAGDVKYSKFGGNVFSVSREQKKRIDSPHPHQKPIELLNNVLGYFQSYNLLFDPFLGSGSTMVAAHQLNRKCYGMELDPKYCQVIIDRMRKLDPTLIIKRNGVIYE